MKAPQHPSLPVRRGLAVLLLLTVIALIGSCRRDSVAPPDAAGLLNLPPGFPAPPFPPDNELTYARWALGKKLFYEPALSRDSTLSCASCHQPALAFTDGRRVSLGVENREGLRNAPTLANVAYHPYFMKEGGVRTLEMQVAVPIEEHAEFDFNFVLLGQRLAADDAYQRMSREAYDRPIDPYVISRAIAAFERTLISGRSAYDRFEQGQSDALSEQALRGRALFFSSRTDCFQCHGGLDFSNYGFFNNGLYAEYTDPGRARLTGLEEDRALFKVPSLRNIELTAPYMHDGSLSSLDEVITHYLSGGAGHVNQSPLIRPLDLSDEEAADLKAFLLALTDPDFLTNPAFLPE
jgi:cytochrome c peroxidase